MNPYKMIRPFPTVESMRRKTNAEKIGDLYVKDEISLLELEERLQSVFEAGTADEYTDMVPLAPPKPDDAARSVVSPERVKYMRTKQAEEMAQKVREITPHIPWQDEECMQCLVAASD